MALRFEGKIALVTGGSRGIGKGIVEALISEGAKVYVIGKVKENLEKLKLDIPSVNTVQVDVSDWNKTKQEVENIGVIDLLVNNAGISDNSVKFVEVSKDLFDKLIDVNFKSAFNITQIVAKKMISEGRPGAVVNISSVFGKQPRNPNVSYCVSKAMMEMLTKCTALELGPHNIRVNTVQPTLTLTDLAQNLLTNHKEFVAALKERHPLKKFDEVQDIADATLFLLSDDASMITGSSVPVDGGYLLS